MPEPARLVPDLDTLARLFDDSPAALGEFHEVEAHEMPPVYRHLLAHEYHMTVTVEEHHGQAVRLRVLDARLDEEHYARKILLELSDGRVVQFGLVRLKLKHLSPSVREEVLERVQPLGRILIAHNVLRTVRLYSLYRLIIGPELADYFGVPQGTTTFGRTAVIDCDGSPAIELLEIVAPEQESQERVLPR